MVADRIRNAWNIFTTSFAFIQRDKSLVIVPVLMLISALFLCTIGIIVLLLISPLQRGYQIVITILYVLFAQTWLTFLGSMQSWMVHETAQHKDATLASGFRRAAKNWKDIIAYAVVFLIISTIIGAIRRRGQAGRIAGGFLDAFAGIIGKLVLPAMIVSERNFGEAITQLKEAKQAIPEILSYEIGIRPLIFLAVIASAIIAYLLGQASVTMAVVFAIVMIVFLILAVTFVNNTYYTLLYLTLIEKKHVRGLHLR